MNQYLGGSRPDRSRSSPQKKSFIGDVPSPFGGSIEFFDTSSQSDISADDPPGEFVPRAANKSPPSLTTGSMNKSNPHPFELLPHVLLPLEAPLEVVSNVRDLDIIPNEPELHSKHEPSDLEIERSEEIDEGYPEESPDIKEWNLLLPVIASPNTLIAGLGDVDDQFNIQNAIGAIQNGSEFQAIRSYLERYDKRTVQQNINNEIEGIPAMFYIVATNNEALLRLWVGHGGNPEAVHTPSNVPLLAFAIVHSETIQADTSLMTSTLLSLGAMPGVIPSAFYTPYLQDVPDNGPPEENDKTEKGGVNLGMKWCTGTTRKTLARTITLLQRYYLEKASKLKKPSGRHKQLAERRNAEALLGLPYFLIGQTLASDLLLSKLLSHLVAPGKRPLVLVFAGPSGHGKTELARKLGHLLSLDLEVVDCTIFNQEMELFGPREPYIGSEKGSPLNNFLARNAGQRCIVFLDEFEKTNPGIHKTLLLPFDNGRTSYVDCDFYTYQKPRGISR
jgi:hypothetical protein